MKGSDKIKMNINISGELIKLDVRFDDQNAVRDAEREIKLYIERIKKQWPDISDRKILAMAAYQYADWYLRLKNIQQDAIDICNKKSLELEKLNIANSL